MTDCDHKLTAVSLNHVTRAVTVRCETCGEEQTLPCEFAFGLCGELEAIVWPHGWVKHIETRIEFEADTCPAKSPHNG